MVINMSTETGYYDAIGQFHSNTGLLPSPVPYISYTVPIDKSKGYDWAPVFIPPDIPNITIPKIDIPKFGIPNFDVSDPLGLKNAPKDPLGLGNLTMPILVLAAVMLLGKD